MGEAAEAFGLEGFEGGLFNSVGTTFTTQLLQNIENFVSMSVSSGTTANPSLLFANFDTARFYGNVSGAIGGYLGTYVATQVIQPDNTQAGWGSTIGSAAGSTLGTSVAATLVTETMSAVLGVLIPGIGAFIGAFLGTVLGTVIGNAVAVDEKSWGSVWIDTWQGKALAGNYGSDNEGDWKTFASITSAQAELVNRIVDITGARITGLKQPSTGSVGYWQKGKTYTTYMPDGSAYDFVSRLTPDPDAAWARVADEGIVQLVDDVSLEGGNPFKRQALAHSKATSAGGILADLQIATDYETYIRNAEAINLLLVKEKLSAFSTGWVATLLEAKRLGLGEIRELWTRGTKKADALAGTTLIDHMTGLAGDDTISGRDGGDILDGGAGDDLLKGEAGDDRLLGGAGDDTLQGGAGRDDLAGGDGDDRLWARMATTPCAAGPATTGSSAARRRPPGRRRRPTPTPRRRGRQRHPGRRTRQRHADRRHGP